MWLVSVPLRAGHERPFRDESRISALALTLGSYLACTGILFGISVATVGLHLTPWRGLFRHLGCTLAIFALYGWETARQPRNFCKKKARDKAVEN